MEPEIPLEEIIAGLGDPGQPLAGLGLVHLSNLDAAGMALFQTGWAAIGVERRRQIIQRLVEMAEGSVELSFDSIFRYCLKDRDAGVRGQAIAGLWESEEPSLITPLIEMLEDSSPGVQAAAANALGRFALLAELGKLRSYHAARICQALLAVVGDELRDVEVRRRALEAVAPFSLPEVTAAITAAYQGPDPGFRASAVYAMGRNCGPHWLPVVLGELASSDTEIRCEAAEACGELGEAEAVPRLVRLTRDADEDVQLAAIRALGKIGGKEAREHLKRCLGHPEPQVREAVEAALEALAAEEASFLLWGTA